MLSAAPGEENLLPRRFGLGPRCAVRAVVLANPAMRIGIAPEAGLADVDVLPGDALFPALRKRRGRRVGAALERTASQVRERVCEGLVALHRPARREVACPSNPSPPPRRHDR